MRRSYETAGSSLVLATARWPGVTDGAGDPRDLGVRRAAGLGGGLRAARARPAARRAAVAGAAPAPVRRRARTSSRTRSRPPWPAGAGDLAGKAVDDELTLRLPSAADGPLASPELVRPPAGDPPAAPAGRARLSLAAWRVPVLVFEPAAAAPLLRRAGRRWPPGDVVAERLGRLPGRGRPVRRRPGGARPGAARARPTEDGGYAARWRPVLSARRRAARPRARRRDAARLPRRRRRRRPAPRPARCSRACSTRWRTRRCAPGCLVPCCPRAEVAAPARIPVCRTDAALL